MIHYGTRGFPTWWYITHKHRVFGLLYMHEVPVKGLIKDDNACLNPTLHGVCSVYNRIEMQETVFCFKKVPNVYDPNPPF